MSPATVATSTTYTAVRSGFQRKGFYAEGLFWAFYSDGTNAGWEFSNDGTTWDGGFTSIGACTSGRYFSVWFDGTYVHYARTDLGGTFDLFYRRGTPVNDGTITWSAVEQTVYAGSSGDAYHFPCIAVDTNGYAWIGAVNDDPGGDDFPVILKNDNNDGTWSNDFIAVLKETDTSTWKVVPVPLTSGKVYVVYCMNAAAPLGKLYDSGWGSEESDLADYAIEGGSAFSAAADGDDVHFVYNRDVTYQIRYNKRVYGVGWNADDVLVQDGVALQTIPALSVDPSRGDLYCFWASLSTDHVYYKKYSSGSWGDLVDWIDETADLLEPTPEPTPEPIVDTPPEFEQESEPEPEGGFPILLALLAAVVGAGIGVGQGFKEEHLDRPAPTLKKL